MSTKIKTRYHYKNSQRSKEQIANIWRQARDYWWSQATINERLAKVWNDPTMLTQPMYVKEFLRGYSTACFDMHWSHLVFSYNCGEHGRLSIESPEYKAISPQEIHEKYSDTGCYVYRDNLNAMFC